MITKYRTGNYKLIEKVEVERETEHYVWFKDMRWGAKGNERREAKRSVFDNFFDTWEEARDFLKNEVEIKLRLIESRKKSLVSGLEKINALREDTE